MYWMYEIWNVNIFVVRVNRRISNKAIIIIIIISPASKGWRGASSHILLLKNTLERATVLHRFLQGVLHTEPQNHV